MVNPPATVVVYVCGDRRGPRVRRCAGSACLVLALAAFAAAPAQAQQRTVVTVEEWVEVGSSATRFVMPPAVEAEDRAIAAYGPFRVLDDRTARAGRCHR